MPNFPSSVGSSWSTTNKCITRRNARASRTIEGEERARPHQSHLQHIPWQLLSRASRNDEGNIVVLFSPTELLDCAYDFFPKSGDRQDCVRLHSLNEAVLTELFPLRVRRLRD